MQGFKDGRCKHVRIKCIQQFYLKWILHFVATTNCTFITQIFQIYFYTNVFILGCTITHHIVFLIRLFFSDDKEKKKVMCRICIEVGCSWSTAPQCCVWKINFNMADIHLQPVLTYAGRTRKQLYACKIHCELTACYNSKGKKTKTLYP